MDRPILPRVERPVSRLVLGQSAPAEVLPDLYDRFVELGGNAFETARWYPTEPALGRWLAGRTDRSDLFVATKGCHPAVQDGPPRVNPEAIRQDLAESLSRLQIDRVDQVHFVAAPLEFADDEFRCARAQAVAPHGPQQDRDL